MSIRAFIGLKRPPVSLFCTQERVGASTFSECTNPHLIAQQRTMSLPIRPVLMSMLQSPPVLAHTQTSCLDPRCSKQALGFPSRCGMTYGFFRPLASEAHPLRAARLILKVQMVRFKYDIVMLIKTAS